MVYTPPLSKRLPPFVPEMLAGYRLPDGTSFQALVNLNHSLQTGIVATPAATVNNAVQLLAAISTIGTAVAGSGVLLPNAAAGNRILIRNAGANDVRVFAPNFATINGIAGSTGILQAPGSYVWYICDDPGDGSGDVEWNQITLAGWDGDGIAVTAAGASTPRLLDDWMASLSGTFGVQGYTGTAAQAAINAAIAAGGGTVVLPPGHHYWTDVQPTIDLSILSSLVAGARIDFIGSGSSDCYVHLNTNNATALAVTGGGWANGGAQLRIKIGGFTLQGGSQNKTLNRVGISLNRVIASEFFDLNVMECETGIVLTDTVITRFISCLFQFNSYGLYAQAGPDLVSNIGSPPNEIVFVGTHFANNYEHGAWFDQAPDGRGASTNISFIGGSFENTGINGTDTDKWGIRITNGGYNGPNILGMYGTHFEGTSGKASIWIEHDNYPGIYNIDADFTRNGAYYATNEILFDTTGDTKAVVNIRSGFNSVNGYTPSAARRYIAEGTVVGTSHRICYLGCMFESATEMPSFGDQSLIPQVTGITSMGTLANVFANIFAGALWLPGGITILSANGNPEGVVTAGPGSYFLRNDGSSGSFIYRKDNGSGFDTTGWTAIL